MADRASETTRIGDHDYRVVVLGSKRATLVWLRLLKVFGPSIGELFTGAKDVKNPLDMPLDALGGAISKLSQDITPADLEFLVTEFVAMTEVSNEIGNLVPLASRYEDHFAGKLEQMFMWLGFAIKVNFSGFFDAFKQAAATMVVQRAVMKAQRSPDTSTGTPTA